jgi:hypothetical protein
MERIQELAGYFDFEHDYENFIRFLDNQATYYRDADCLFYAGLVLLTRFRHNIFTYGDMRLLNHVCGGKRLIDYTFVEAVMPFLNSFKTWGDGRRILIISPFSRSLQSQYERLDELIVDFQYPSFDLVTYTSPLTWSTMQDTRLTLGVTTDNWHQECQRMTAEIAELAFDIALLSCGSYTMHLGNFIRHTMEKKAVYVGGMLNVFFNIYGERYNTPFYNRFMRADTQIEAIENDMAESLSGGKKLASEAARAYFGRIPSPTPE